MRILVVGAGALGGYFGGRLVEAERDVAFLVRPARAEQIARHGLRIESARGDAHLRPRTVLAGGLDGPYDLFLLAVKAYSLDAAMGDLAPAVGPGTAVLPVLNGVRHLDALASRFGRDRVLGGVAIRPASGDDAAGTGEASWARTDRGGAQCASAPPPGRPRHGSRRPRHRHPSGRDRGRHLPPLHARAAERLPGRLHLQPVPRARRRAAAVPHRPPPPVPGRERGRRPPHALGAAAPRLVLALNECGALNQFLAAAPHAAPLCGRIGARVSIADFADREPRPLADGEAVELGRRRVRWIDAPHLPHGWDCGCLMEEATGTLLCGDLFAEGGAEHPALAEGDILGPSEAFRASVDYYSHTRHARALLGKLAACAPTTLARMHGSAWRGDGAALLRALADRLDP